MSTTQKEKHIELFPDPSAPGDLEVASCGDSCNCGSSCPISLPEMKTLAEEVGAQFWQAEYTSKEHMTEAIQKLNDAFSESGIKVTLNTTNFRFMLSHVTPVMLVDGKVIAFKSLPSKEQFETILGAAHPMPIQGGCNL